MRVRGLPSFGNKLEEDSDEPDVRSDFEEYRGLGPPSIDSFTLRETNIDDIIERI